MDELTDTANRLLALSTYIDRDTGKLVARTGECEPEAISSQIVVILKGRDEQRDKENRKKWEWEMFGQIAKEEYCRESNRPETGKDSKKQNWEAEETGKEHILHEIYFKRIRKALSEQSHKDKLANDYLCAADEEKKREG